MARFGMVIDTKRCVGCMDCVVACKTENQVPEGFNRDWITTEVRGKFPTLSMEIRTERCNHCDNPPCVTCCPTGASHVEEFGKIVLVDPRPVHRLQGLPRLLPLRRALHPPGGLCRQVHVLHPPGEGGQGPRLRRGLPDPLHALRRPRRPPVGGLPPARRARPPRAHSRSRHEAAHLLSDLRENDVIELTTTRANHLVDPVLAGLGLADSGLPLPRRPGRRDDDHLGLLPLLRPLQEHPFRLLRAPGFEPRPALARDARALPRSRAQALRLAALHHLRAALTDVLGRLDSRARLSGADRQPSSPCARAAACPGAGAG